MAASGTRNVTAVCIHSVVCLDSRMVQANFQVPLPPVSSTMSGMSVPLSTASRAHLPDGSNSLAPTSGPRPFGMVVPRKSRSPGP